MYSKSPPAEKARPEPVSTATLASSSASNCGNSAARPGVEDVVGGVEPVGTVQRDDPDRAVGLDLISSGRS